MTDIMGISPDEAMRYVNDWAVVAIGAVLMTGVVIGIIRNAWRGW